MLMGFSLSYLVDWKITSSSIISMWVVSSFLEGFPHV
jgi:hypothetical protein